MKLLLLHLVLSLLASSSSASVDDNEDKQLVVPQRRELQDSNAPFYIVNTGTNRVVDVSGGRCGSGTNIHLWTRNGSPAQMFRFGPNNSIVNTGCNKVLDVSGGNCNQGTNIQLWDPNGSGAQRWRLKDNMALENIRCNKVLDIARNAMTDGTNIWLWGENGTGAQKWTIEYMGRTGGPTPNNNSWEGPLTAPLIGSAAAALPDGRVLLWSAFAKYSFGGSGQTWTAIFDPNTKRFTQELIQTIGHDMFCPGIAGLGDGRIMVTGGSNSERTTFYDPSSNMWAAGPRMNIPRGYHTMVTLTDGSVLTIGGSWSGGVGNKDGELFLNNRWYRKPGIRAANMLTNDVRVNNRDYFMWLFQVRISHCGSDLAGAHIAFY